MRWLILVTFMSSVGMAEEVRVGVVDTGVYTHKDFATQVLIINEQEQNLVGSETLSDTDGHGTHVAGIINYYAPEAILVALKVQTPEMTDRKDVVREEKGTLVKNLGMKKIVEFAIKNHIRILNLSMVISKSSSELIDAVKAAEKNNILIVAGAGNMQNDMSNPELLTYPCGLKASNVICVGSYLESEDHKLSPVFSNRGKDYIEAWAKGVSVFSTDIPKYDNYNVRTGTSQATPKITAVAANILKDNPDLSVKDLKQKVLDSLKVSKDLLPYSLTGKYLPHQGIR